MFWSRSSEHWHDLGLAAKYKGEWAESLRCNQKAVELKPGNEAAWWNLGIAATALRNWAEARRAWRGFGIDIAPGDTEIRDVGQTACVRLNPAGDGEVVWGERIDPARMVIRSVPLVGSGHRFRDIVLHDGAPSGTRKLGDGEVDVFDELELWEASSFVTYEAALRVPSGSAREGLIELCAERGVGIEDWSTLRWICAECSRGNPGPHDCKAGGPENPTISYAIAAESEASARELLEEWKRRWEGADCLGLAKAV